MGSVIGDMKCPQCGGRMVTDYYYRTDEEYRFCKRCGKRQDWFWERDENDKIILDENGKPIPQEIDDFGYGCICLLNDSGSGELVGLNHPITEDDKKEFFEILENNKDTIDKSKCYFTYWDEEENIVKSYFGEIPPTYDEFYEDIEGGNKE